MTLEGLLLLLVAAAVLTALLVWRSREVTIIYPPAVGLLYRDGRFVRELPPGRYARFDLGKRTRVVKVSSAELPTQLPEITVISKDQFSFRVSLAPVLRIAEPRAFVESQPVLEAQGLMQFTPLIATHPTLNTLASAAALQAAGAHTLAELLAEPRLIIEAVQLRLAEAIAGAMVERLLLTAINLPPETRKMFTDVERARVEGQAALERARGEQAALRALANAARLITDNPALANLRLLQAIESSKGSTTVILGNPGLPMAGLDASGARPPSPPSP